MNRGKSHEDRREIAWMRLEACRREFLKILEHLASEEVDFLTEDRSEVVQEAIDAVYDVVYDAMTQLDVMVHRFRHARDARLARKRRRVRELMARKRDAQRRNVLNNVTDLVTRGGMGAIRNPTESAPADELPCDPDTAAEASPIDEASPFADFD